MRFSFARTGAKLPGSGRRPLVGALERRNVELLHLQERFRHPLRLLDVAIAKHGGQYRWHDLPREAEAVLEPAAGALFAALAQLAPEVVDLLLRLTSHLERDGLVEREVRPAIQSGERVASETEGHGHHQALRLS